MVTDDDSNLRTVQAIYKLLDPLNRDDRARVLGAVNSLLDIPKIETPIKGQIPLGGHSPSGASGPDLAHTTIKAFLKSKEPQGISQRLACLAYFLDRHDQAVELTAKILKRANDTASLPHIDDISRDLSSAARRELLFTKTAPHTYRLTSLGEEVVEVLPDQEAVKAVIVRWSKKVKTRKRAKSLKHT